MKKEKFQIEYVFDKGSKNSLWNHISTSSGLSEWFADDVSINDNIFSFSWDGHVTNAEVVRMNPGVNIRFRWLDEEDPEAYFELRLHTIELTGGIMLEITDFAEKGDKDNAINIWDSQVKTLCRILGL